MTTTVRATSALLRDGAVAPAPERRPSARPDLQLVSHRPRRRLVGVVVTLASMALFASLFGLAVFHTMLVGSQSTIDEIESEIVAARSETEQLRLQVAELEAPERILSVASDDLGMVSPSEVLTLTAGDTDGASGTPPDAPPADEPGTNEPGAAVSGDGAEGSNG